jgi:hypothetical protein
MHQIQPILTAPVAEIVAGFVEQFKARWYACASSLPDLGEPYTIRQQLDKEKEMESYLDALFDELRKAPPAPDEVEAVQQRLIDLFFNIAKVSLGLQQQHFDYLLKQGFRQVTAEFTRMARRFDPLISEQDIYQAYRNASSMHLMQLLLSLPIEVTPSVFGFSMLYPYTDNYLDNPDISAGQKEGFNERFRQRIAGEEAAAANHHEEIAWQLIGKIEEQYDRQQYPHIFESLLAIQDAQIKSIDLLHSPGSPYELDVMGTCFEKGGAAALADGFLVAGHLTPEQQEFVFFYGVYTQLVDDLEDLFEDRKRGINTIFSLTADRWPLDGMTNRMFHFGRQALDALDSFKGPSVEPLKEMMGICFTPMLIDSASTAGRFYTRPYLRHLQRHFPFRFGFLKKQRKRFARQSDSLKLMLEALMMYALVQRSSV